jgi:hypothetical protein
MRACVYDCGKVDLGRVVGSYPADSFDWPIAGNVDRCRTSSFGEDAKHAVSWLAVKKRGFKFVGPVVV